jgi:N-acetylmuramoyl-L-alanine amidase
MKSFSLIKTLQNVISTALIVASLFTLWTPANLFTGQVFDSMLFALNETEKEEIFPTATPFLSSQRIGIVAGHWKDPQNSGFVCQDGLTEEQVNLRIATLVLQNLTDKGYKVDLLEEFDTRLTQYKALALVSIHSDSCEYVGDEATGYKVAPAMVNSFPEDANRLAECIQTEYKLITGMKFQTNKLTTDMTTYHTFNEVHSSTPIVIMEAGYMNLDRRILTDQAETIASGIAEGILCYIRDDAPAVEASVTP